MIFLQPYKKYFNFSGRASRKEYWSFLLFYLTMSFILRFLDHIIGTFNDFVGYGIVSGVFLLGSIIPSFTVSSRRLHDINRSSNWLLLMIIPVIGQIWLGVLFCFKGDKGPNQFGSDPLEISDENGQL